MIENICKNCAWYSLADEQHVNGECRAKSPQKFEYDFDRQRDAEWPIVREDNWCKEFNHRPATN